MSLVHRSHVWERERLALAPCSQCHCERAAQSMGTSGARQPYGRFGLDMNTPGSICRDPKWRLVTRMASTGKYACHLKLSTNPGAMLTCSECSRADATFVGVNLTCDTPRVPETLKTLVARSAVQLYMGQVAS